MWPGTYISSWCGTLWPSDAICRQRTGSKLVEVMAWCLMAPSQYLNQCWLTLSVRSPAIHLWALSWEDLKISISKANMKIAFLKLYPETSELSMTQAFNRCSITHREHNNSSAANGWVQSLLPVNYALSVWGITGISFPLSGVGNNCCKVTINRCVCGGVVCVDGGGNVCYQSSLPCVSFSPFSEWLKHWLPM